MVAPPNVDNNEEVNSDFVPYCQKLSGVLALCNGTILLLLGGMFLIVPQMALSILLDYNNNNNTIIDPSLFTFHLTSYDNGTEIMQKTMRMASYNIMGEYPSNIVTRMVGCVLLGQGLSCLILLYPLLVEESSSQKHSRMAVWNVRTAIIIQGVTGLLWILIGLWDDRTNNEADSRSDVVPRRNNTLGLLLVGFVILVLACLSLMLSFWPVHHHLTVTEGTTPGVNISSSGEVSTARDGLLEPLLSPEDEVITQHDNFDDDQIQEEHGNVDNAGTAVNHGRSWEVSDTNVEEETASMHLSDTAVEGTSRIRGTRRLLKLAAPQVIYLYVGCLTLLIRLPFSLSIPHFVATTLGALSQGEFDRARREISWLFILGTIDAWYVCTVYGVYNPPES